MKQIYGMTAADGPKFQPLRAQNPALRSLFKVDAAQPIEASEAKHVRAWVPELQHIIIVNCG